MHYLKIKVVCSNLLYVRLNIVYSFCTAYFNVPTGMVSGIIRFMCIFGGLKMQRGVK